MQKITPFLWFNDNAEEAANFYTAIFKNSKIKHIARYGEAGHGPKGSVMTVSFELNGNPFIALNGGPHFKFNESISFVVDCDNQEEIDHLWNALIANGGQPSHCGWLKDRFGLSWQIVPPVLGEMLSNQSGKSVKVMEAMLKMGKLDIATLKEAYEEV